MWGEFLTSFPKYSDDINPKEGEVSKGLAKVMINKRNKISDNKNPPKYLILRTAARYIKRRMPQPFSSSFVRLSPFGSLGLLSGNNGYSLNSELFLSTQTLPRANSSPPSHPPLKHLWVFLFFCCFGGGCFCFFWGGGVTHGIWRFPG